MDHAHVRPEPVPNLRYMIQNLLGTIPARRYRVTTVLFFRDSACTATHPACQETYTNSMGRIDSVGNSDPGGHRDMRYA